MSLFFIFRVDLPESSDHLVLGTQKTDRASETSLPQILLLRKLFSASWLATLSDIFDNDFFQGIQMGEEMGSSGGIARRQYLQG